MKNYINKIIRIHYRRGNAIQNVTGIVCFQHDKTTHTLFELCQLDGGEVELSIANDSIEKITAVRLEPDVRKALERYCKARRDQKEFLTRFWKEKAAYENEVAAARTALVKSSGILGFGAFEDAVIPMLQRATNIACKRDERIYLSSLGDDSFTICHETIVDKYVKPSQWPFLNEEYDMTLRINTKDKGYQRFCDTYAPAVITKLKACAKKVSTSADVGDKNTLVAERNYTFALSHGKTRKSVEQFNQMLEKK